VACTTTYGETNWPTERRLAGSKSASGSDRSLCVESLNAQIRGLFCSPGVDLDAVRVNALAVDQCQECIAVTNTRINCGTLCGKVQPVHEAFCFSNGKGEKPSLV
jgi:hypothetical protein